MNQRRQAPDRGENRRSRVDHAELKLREQPEWSPSRSA
jgi:hypothetical protein